MEGFIFYGSEAIAHLCNPMKPGLRAPGRGLKSKDSGMANYHCSIKTFSRSKGHSSVAAAAYRAGEKLESEKYGKTEDYTKRKGVVSYGVIAPKDAPDWVNNIQTLWNKAEEKEVRKNSTVAREFEISLPHELNKEQREVLAKELTQNLVDRFGFVAMYAIHEPEPGELNQHVHILATTRKIDATGFTDKTRELDDMKRTQDQKFNPAIVEVRAMVADTVNKHLELAGIDERVSHKSLVDQRQDAIDSGDLCKALELDREPTKHIGKNPENKISGEQFNQEIISTNEKRLDEFEDSINSYPTRDVEKPKIEESLKQEPLLDNFESSVDDFELPCAEDSEEESDPENSVGDQSSESGDMASALMNLFIKLLIAISKIILKGIAQGLQEAAKEDNERKRKQKFKYKM